LQRGYRSAASYLLSLVLSSGALAHVKALIISHVAVRRRHVCAARISLGRSIICCHSCSAVARLLTSSRSSYHTWPSMGGTKACSKALAAPDNTFNHGNMSCMHNVLGGISACGCSDLSVRVDATARQSSTTRTDAPATCCNDDGVGLRQALQRISHTPKCTTPGTCPRNARAIIPCTARQVPCFARRERLRGHAVCRLRSSANHPTPYGALLRAMTAHVRRHALSRVQ
jgi:hypothetical protein